MKAFASAVLVVASTSSCAQTMGFKCVIPPTDGVRWEYGLVVNKSSGKGTFNGTGISGANDEFKHPYTWPIQVVFTPDQMYFQKIGDASVHGTIHRKTLHFSCGGGEGKCSLVPVKATGNIF